ncbi:hypothetical protein BD31_I1564, partial [Candidatus Nitrosopumilus salaria BD31]
KNYLIELNDVEDEKYSKIKPLQDWEIYMDLYIPSNERISKKMKDVFQEVVKSWRSKSIEQSKIGVSKEIMDKEFNRILQKTNIENKEEK